jgi:hypothetical protein
MVPPFPLHSSCLGVTLLLAYAPCVRANGQGRALAVAVVAAAAVAATQRPWRLLRRRRGDLLYVAHRWWWQVMASLGCAVTVCSHVAVCDSSRCLLFLLFFHSMLLNDRITGEYIDCDASVISSGNASGTKWRCDIHARVFVRFAQHSRHPGRPLARSVRHGHVNIDVAVAVAVAVSCGVSVDVDVGLSICIHTFKERFPRVYLLPCTDHRRVCSSFTCTAIAGNTNCTWRI